MGRTVQITKRTEPNLKYFVWLKNQTQHKKNLV